MVTWCAAWESPGPQTPCGGVAPRGIARTLLGRPSRPTSRDDPVSADAEPAAANIAAMAILMDVNFMLRMVKLSSGNFMEARLRISGIGCTGCIDCFVLQNCGKIH